MQLICWDERLSGLCGPPRCMIKWQVLDLRELHFEIQLANGIKHSDLDFGLAAPWQLLCAESGLRWLGNMIRANPMNMNTSLLPTTCCPKNSDDGDLINAFPLKLAVAFIKPRRRSGHVVVNADQAHHKLRSSWPLRTDCRWLRSMMNTHWGSLYKNLQEKSFQGRHFLFFGNCGFCRVWRKGAKFRV